MAALSLSLPLCSRILADHSTERSDELLIFFGFEPSLIGFPFLPLGKQEANPRNDNGSNRANKNAIHENAYPAFVPIDLACMNCSR